MDPSISDGAVHRLIGSPLVLAIARVLAIHLGHLRQAVRSSFDVSLLDCPVEVVALFHECCLYAHLHAIVLLPPRVFQLVSHRSAFLKDHLDNIENGKKIHKN